MSSPLLFPPQARALIDQSQDLLILDIRESDELHTGILPGAVHRPLSSFRRWNPALLAHTGPLLIYCHSGARSAQLCAWLEERDFGAAFDLAGGVLRWVQEGEKLVSRDLLKKDFS
jgi:rhodanese-related sulfurtransferase